MEEKGKLLYVDRRGEGAMRKSRRREAIISIVVSAFLLVVSLITLALLVSELRGSVGKVTRELVVLLISFGFTFPLGLVSAAYGLLVRRETGGLEIYENGLSVPLIKGFFSHRIERRFVPYEEIRTVVLSRESDHLIVGERNGELPIENEYVSDIEILRRMLDSKASVSLESMRSERTQKSTERD